MSGGQYDVGMQREMPAARDTAMNRPFDDIGNDTQQLPGHIESAIGALFHHRLGAQCP